MPYQALSTEHDTLHARNPLQGIKNKESIYALARNALQGIKNMVSIYGLQYKPEPPFGMEKADCFIHCLEIIDGCSTEADIWNEVERVMMNLNYVFLGKLIESYASVDYYGSRVRQLCIGVLRQKEYVYDKKSKDMSPEEASIIMERGPGCRYAYNSHYWGTCDEYTLLSETVNGECPYSDVEKQRIKREVSAGVTSYFLVNMDRLKDSELRLAKVEFDKLPIETKSGFKGEKDFEDWVVIVSRALINLVIPRVQWHMFFEDKLQGLLYNMWHDQAELIPGNSAGAIDHIKTLRNIWSLIVATEREESEVVKSIAARLDKVGVRASSCSEAQSQLMDLLRDIELHGIFDRTWRLGIKDRTLNEWLLARLPIKDAEDPLIFTSATSDTTEMFNFLISNDRRGHAAPMCWERYTR